MPNNGKPLPLHYIDHVYPVEVARVPDGSQCRTAGSERGGGPASPPASPARRVPLEPLSLQQPPASQQQQRGQLGQEDGQELCPPAQPRLV